MTVLGPLRRAVSRTRDAGKRHLHDEIAAAVRLLNLHSEAVICLDEDGFIVVFNQGAECIFGCAASEAVGQPVGFLLRPLTRVQDGDAPWPFTDSEPAGNITPGVVRVVGVRRNGREFVAEMSVSRFRHEGAWTSTLVLRDATAAREVETRLMRLAMHDPLTGLANRTLFDQRLADALVAARGDTTGGVVLACVDIDRFKRINDAYGHPVGDMVLRTTAERLQRATRGSDVVARIGGDEFAVVLAHVSGRMQAEVAMEKLQQALGVSFWLGGEHVYATASIGYALFPQDGVDAGGLLASADHAMYAAKHRRKASVGRLAAEGSARVPVALSARAAL